MTVPIFFRPQFKEKIWGGERMKTLFNMDIPSRKTGECWLLSALAGDESLVCGGAFASWSLADLWRERRDLFGDLPGDEFPLLVKIIDAGDDLSVQVHPDDATALALPGARPKSECWIVLDCPEGASIVFGHHAATRPELEDMVRRGEWARLLRRLPVRRGDFVNVPGGTAHALTKGCMVLEVQQPSDTTYRFYDYDRLENGAPRPLHLREALVVTSVPSCEESSSFQTDSSVPGIERTILARSAAFSVFRYRIEARAMLRHDVPFLALTVTQGQGTLDGRPIRAGECCLLPCGRTPVVEGPMEIVGATREKE